jgi:hypothetical protein
LKYFSRCRASSKVANSSVYTSLKPFILLVVRVPPYDGHEDAPLNYESSLCTFFRPRSSKDTRYISLQMRCSPPVPDVVRYVRAGTN